MQNASLSLPREQPTSGQDSVKCACGISTSADLSRASSDFTYAADKIADPTTTNTIGYLVFCPNSRNLYTTGAFLLERTQIEGSFRGS
jgi:hypothetical protein